MLVSQDARRVLIYRVGSLGDTVVAIPCLHLIERTFPNAERALLTNFPVHAKAPAAKAVIGDSGLVHRYIDFAVGTRNPLTLARLWLSIRRFRPDVLVYLMPRRNPEVAKRDLRFFRACGIKGILGVPELTEESAKPKYFLDRGLYEHEAERLARCLHELGNVDLNDSANWDLRLTAAETKKADMLLGNFGAQPMICWAIGAKRQPNDWGVENWEALSSALGHKFLDYGLVLLGTKEEHIDSDRASRKWPGRRLNLCGQLSPRESAAVMARAELFVGPDSGPGHLAAAVGTPCASVFSARDLPGLWYPYGRSNQVIYHQTDCFYCRTEMCIEQKKKCILSITVDEVVSAAMKAWELGKAERRVVRSECHGLTGG
jgi:heptosyltransferase III